MDIDEFEEALVELFEVESEEAHTDGFEHEISRVSTFEEEGVLTRDRGIVVFLADGSKFYLTIQEGR